MTTSPPGNAGPKAIDIARLATAWGPTIIGGCALAVLAPSAQFPPLPQAILFALLVGLAPNVYAFVHGGYQTLVAAVILPGILLFGPVPAALFAGVAIAARRWKQRVVAESLAYSAGQRVVATLVAGALLSVAAEGRLVLSRAAKIPADGGALLAIAVLAVAYAGTSAVQVALRYASRRQERLVVLLRDNLPFDVFGTLVVGMVGVAAVLPLVAPITREIDAVAPVLLSGLAGQLWLLWRWTSRQSAELRDAVADLLRAPDLDELLRRLAHHVDRIARPDIVWVALRGSNGGHRVIMARGAEAPVLARLIALPDGLSWTLDLRTAGLIDDYRRDKRFNAEVSRTLGDARVRSVLAVPLLIGDELLGALVLARAVPAYFTEVQAQSVGALAAQAALTMKNASLSRATTQLLRESEHRAHELGLINRIVTRVAILLQPEKLFAGLVEELHETLGYPLVSILLVDDGRLRIVARHGYPPDASLEFVLGHGIVGRAVRTGRVQLVEDVSRDPDYVRTTPGVRQHASVPIMGEHGPEGVISVETMEPTLTSGDVELLSTLAAQVREAMRNAALFAEIQQARDELAGLHEAAQALSRSLELATVLDGLVTVTCRRFGYDHGAILMLDGNALVVRAVHGHRWVPGQRIAGGQDAEGRAASESRAVAVLDASPEGPGARAAGGGASLAVPLLRESNVIGVFSVAVDRPGAFGVRDERIMTTLAGYAAVAIENAVLYEQTRDLATTDGLTGLLNHRSFWQAMAGELERARRYGSQLSLIVVEIDRFKRYNDTYGHLKGDEVLRLIARVLEREHRSRIDTAARYGGDEFMLLLPHSSKASSAAVAERVRVSIEATPYIVEGEVTAVTVSLGVATFPEDGDTANALVEAADRRMYAAKRLGGNCVAAAQT